MSVTRTPQGVEVVWERYLFDDETRHRVEIDCGCWHGAIWFDDAHDLGKLLADAVRHDHLPVYAAVVAQSRVAEWFGRYDAEEAAAQGSLPSTQEPRRTARKPPALFDTADPPAPQGDGWEPCPWADWVCNALLTALACVVLLSVLAWGM